MSDDLIHEGRHEWDFLSQDEEAADLCRALLCDERPSSGRLRDPDLAGEVTRRLAAVGFRWAAVDGRAYAVAHTDRSDPDTGMPYTEPQLAAIARLAIDLVIAPAPGEGPRAQVKVDDFHRCFAPERRWSKAWLRRAVLGPLERDGYINVVAPGQRRSDAYIEAGPRLRLLDVRRITQALEDAA